MKEMLQGKSPFATGDAINEGWAATNLSLYSGSSVGFLAAVIQATNVPEILQIDLNKTDFYGDDSLVSYLYFNPTLVVKQVDINLPSDIRCVRCITKQPFSVASNSIQIICRNQVDKIYTGLILKPVTAYLGDRCSLSLSL
jgi:hypothetical protein